MAKRNDVKEVIFILKNNYNKNIKIKKITKQKIYLYLTFAVLFLLTIYTFATMDFGGVNIKISTRSLFKDLKLMFFSPQLSDRYTFLEVLNDLLITISLAILSTIIGSVIALFLAFLSAKNLSGAKTSKIIKVIMSFIRAIPTILWVMVFSVVANIGVEAAVIGMTFHSVAYLVKAYSESFEEIDSGIIEALKSTGASFWQIVFCAIFPSTITSILSWTFIRFEINFTNAVLVGAAAGAGGTGYDMFMAGTMYFDIQEIGVFVYLIFSVAVILELISYFLKKNYLKK
ncbi:ABC transporter permease [Leptotrichia sp. oral taxon 847]|nr:ABC transporter permease [Leptotrichia sp. oral taxon 847]